MFTQTWTWQLPVISQSLPKQIRAGRSHSRPPKTLQAHILKKSMDLCNQSPSLLFQCAFSVYTFLYVLVCLTFNKNTFFLFILLTVYKIFPAAIWCSEISFTLSFNSLPIKESKLNSNLYMVIRVCAWMCLYESLCVCFWQCVCLCVWVYIWVCVNVYLYMDEY